MAVKDRAELQTQLDQTIAERLNLIEAKEAINALLKGSKERIESELADLPAGPERAKLRATLERELQPQIASYSQELQTIAGLKNSLELQIMELRAELAKFDLEQQIQDHQAELQKRVAAYNKAAAKLKAMQQELIDFAKEAHPAYCSYFRNAYKGSGFIFEAQAKDSAPLPIVWFKGSNVGVLEPTPYKGSDYTYFEFKTAGGKN